MTPHVAHRRQNPMTRSTTRRSTATGLLGALVLAILGSGVGAAPAEAFPDTPVPRVHLDLNVSVSGAPAGTNLYVDDVVLNVQ
jgi:hypothetical protein